MNPVPAQSVLQQLAGKVGAPNALALVHYVQLLKRLGARNPVIRIIAVQPEM